MTDTPTTAEMVRKGRSSVDALRRISRDLERKWSPDLEIVLAEEFEDNFRELAPTLGFTLTRRNSSDGKVQDTKPAADTV